jgi:threonine dehydrogenase-like Zn-dependent dehydrogenase
VPAPAPCRIGRKSHAPGQRPGHRRSGAREYDLPDWRFRSIAMKALCWHGKHDVRYETVPDPGIEEPRDAIVKMTSCAICGSDLHLFDGFMPTMEKGDVLGHEFMGEVVEVGPGNKKLRVGDRVVVPFTICCGECEQCQRGNWSVCERSNRNKAIADKVFGHSTAGLFGYSHLTGGYAGGQAEYVRVPFADVAPVKIPDGLSDEQVLFLGDIFPTGWQAKACGALTINFDKESVVERLNELTGGKGPEKCIDCVGMESHVGSTIDTFYDRAKQAVMAESDRPHVLREMIYVCRPAGVLSIPGVYGGLVDKIPFGVLMNKGLTVRTGQTHVKRWTEDLLRRIESGQIDPSFVITHSERLEDGPQMYKTFRDKKDGCIKVVLKP